MIEVINRPTYRVDFTREQLEYLAVLMYLNMRSPDTSPTTGFYSDIQETLDISDNMFEELCGKYKNFL